MDFNTPDSSAAPLRNNSNILFRFTRTGSEVSSCSGPNVGTDSDPLRAIQNVCCDSRHQNRVPTVWRTAVTISVPELVRECTLGPRNDWLERKPEEIAVIAIQASGDVRTDSSRHTSRLRQWPASRPEKPSSVEFSSRTLRPKTARPIG